MQGSEQVQRNGLLLEVQFLLAIHKTYDIPQSERESYMTKLFNANGPTATITAISMDKCSEGLLQICNIPDDARVQLPNSTEASVLGERIFVRGVNSGFIPVLVSGKRYYVHERFIRA